ncbi:hypothetical protein ACGFIF_21705 [Kribbella sp. NPDC049174]|uniref:hypothetical protein n=1 Tax=Kribbella sp. NPDC049174 TaxID=3364112 RepID=UPI003721C01E
MADRRVLDERSDELAASILAPLSERQRERLVAAMEDVSRLLTASMVEVGIVDPRRPDAQYCLRAYFDELGERFDFDHTRSISAGQCRADVARRVAAGRDPALGAGRVRPAEAAR